MNYFVAKDSIVRKIWSSGDTILFIFAGASAEFALNKAVDWLYFTGKLPADPLGRLFSTVAYARKIIFSDCDQAHAAIDQITAIHRGVEQQRAAKIPDWAYRDVLFMLIDYSIRSYELLERKLSDTEKTEIFNVFYRFGTRMQLSGLPENFQEWKLMREQHLQKNLICSKLSIDLFRQYRKHLGWFRYFLLKQVQAQLVPQSIKAMLSLNQIPVMLTTLKFYTLIRNLKLATMIRNAILPSEYREQIRKLHIAS